MSCLRLVLALLACFLWPLASVNSESPATKRKPEKRYPEIEARLKPLAEPLAKPRPGDWLAQHKEAGQTFEEYRLANPVRKSRELTTIYICLIGDFTPQQQKILDATQEYLSLFYQVPVKVRKKMKVEEIPESSRRVHPKWGDKQILTSYVLNDLLKPDRPKDALAYLAFTSGDLYPQPDWNFVFGQASLRERTGVWSIYRNGDPAAGEEEYQLCLKRTLHTASHETGHILTIQHCIALECNMNGVNSQDEGDRKPLHFCPICLRKLCWNLQVEPIPYLQGLETFYRDHGLQEEALWYANAVKSLEGSLP